MTAELHRHRTEDKTEQHEHNGQVEAGKNGCIRRRERGEQRAAGRKKPHLVAIPHRANGAHNALLVALFLCQEGVQNARAQVKAVQGKVANDQHKDDNEPQVSKDKHYSFTSTSSLTGRVAASSCAAIASGPALTVLMKLFAHTT